MTARAKATIRRFEAGRFELRDRVVAKLQTISPGERLEIMVKAGVLTKAGKLTKAYRPSKTVATR
jgi:hypothetical protein